MIGGAPSSSPVASATYRRPLAGREAGDSPRPVEDRQSCLSVFFGGSGQAGLPVLHWRDGGPPLGTYAPFPDAAVREPGVRSIVSADLEDARVRSETFDGGRLRGAQGTSEQ